MPVAQILFVGDLCSSPPRPPPSFFSRTRTLSPSFLPACLPACVFLSASVCLCICVSIYLSGMAVVTCSSIFFIYLLHLSLTSSPILTFQLLSRPFHLFENGIHAYIGTLASTHTLAPTHTLALTHTLAPTKDLLAGRNMQLVRSNSLAIP